MYNNKLLTIPLCLGLIVSCTETPDPAQESATQAASAPSVEVFPQKEVFFGDLHLHSRWSFDAYSLNVAVGPEDAYRFARGEAIAHVDGEIQLQGPPLDFMALTEHAEYLGVSAQLETENPPIKNVDLIKRLSSDDPATRGGALGEFAQSMRVGEGIPALMEDTVIKPAWQRLIALADKYNEPGEFTAFVGYEWTSAPIGNLHRNLIFRGNNVPERPFSALDSIHPEDLWNWMDVTRKNHDDLIAIPHNGNLSAGRMYPLVDSSDNPITSAWARQRETNEPVTEVMQIKGNSETLPELSPNDEWADFDIFNRSVNDLTGSNGPVPSKGSYVREALKEGLRQQNQLEMNPYRLGMIGSTDGHNAAGPFEESNYFGKLGVADGTPEQRLMPSREPFTPDVVARWNAAGLAAVWAESNTREAIFDALRKREAYATSGTRIKLRFFASQKSLSNENRGMAAAYANGVPMGSTISGDKLTFFVHAARDALSAPLERVQIIKGWMDKGESFESVTDIACMNGEPTGNPARCPAIAASSDKNCKALLTAAGAPELTVNWQDPDFDPAQAAFYYVRVLETPTCRWTTYESRAMKVALPEGVPLLIQERAVSSPIWTQ